MTNYRVLVVGGAGYIGSHMIKMLGQSGCAVTTLDDLSSGHQDAVLAGEFVQGNCGDRKLLDELLTRGFDAVMHFASFIQVGESMKHPDKYYQNNVVNTLTLLDAMRAHGVQHFFFHLRRPFLASLNTFRLMRHIPKIPSILTGKPN